MVFCGIIGPWPVELGCSSTRWVAEAAPQIDYWITTGTETSDILSHYADVTGHAPIPGMGIRFFGRVS
jgi:alpha-glucosidase (family GH31 glycosyl hydrolase)